MALYHSLVSLDHSFHTNSFFVSSYDGHHHSPSDTRDGKQLDKALRVVGPPDNLGLDLELGVDVVDVARGLDRVVA